MSFLKNLFTKTKKVKRTLTHPRDLQNGDIIKFKFLSQADLSGKTYEIIQLNTYKYDGEHYPEYVLQDKSSNIIYLMVEEDDGEEYLAISKKIKKSQIHEIIPQQQLDKILKKGSGTKVTISTKPDGLEEWLANSYTETDDNIKGSYAKGDARKQTNSNYQNFISHTLTDSSDEYALEIEIYANNEIELSTTIYHEISEIEDMWPGGNNE